MASTISTPQGIPQSGRHRSIDSPRTWPSMNPFNEPEMDNTNKTDEGVELLSVSWNQDYGCFAAGTTNGFRIYNCDPFKETFRRDLQGGGFGIVEMLFRCNILAIVGGGSHPQYPPNKVMIWDDHQSRCIGEFMFRSEVRAVKLRRDLIVVVLEHKIYVYNFTDLRLLHQIETLANPRGLCCLSYDPNTSVLACPGLRKGEVRVEHFGLKVTKFISAHDSNIACMTLTVDGLLLATASTKGTLIRIFNTFDGTRLQEVRRGLDRADIYSIALSQNVQWLAVSSDKGTVHVFSLRVRVAGDDVSNQNTAGAVADSPVMSRQNSSSSLDAFIPQNTGTNTGSSLSFMRGLCKLVVASSDVVKFVKSEQGEILTKPFLDLCRLLFPIIDKLGPTLSAVRCDVGSNLSRLEAIYSSDPLKYTYLQSIVQAEIEAKTAKKPSSCTNGLLWLTRAMDFFVELLKNVAEHPEWSMTHACTISYNKTLKRWHGWLTSSSFVVALKVVPERKKVIEILGGPNADTEIQRFCTQFVPMLEANHQLLANFGLDNLKSI